ncbi:kinase-like domain-containing protein [Entophlyctis helioformis]|nr:kinase-like domain-containing protein [Entophlyctis helioformis]
MPGGHRALSGRRRVCTRVSGRRARWRHLRLQSRPEAHRLPDEAAMEELRVEVDYHRKLSGHKNIVRFIDSSTAMLRDGSFEVLILMDYCEGGHLVDYLNTKLDTRLNEDEVLRIFSDACEAVAHMHSFNPPIAHRDIKIENVLISSSGVCKLCDFGSCTTRVVPGGVSLGVQDIRRLEDEISKFTTLQYRAPEMCDLYQKKGLNEKVDTWALGILLYKLCYFTTPFEDGGKLAILNVRYTPPSYPQYSPKLMALISALLEGDITKRFNVFQAYAAVCEMRRIPYNLKMVKAHDIGAARVLIANLFTVDSRQRHQSQTLPRLMKLHRVPWGP